MSLSIVRAGVMRVGALISQEFWCGVPLPEPEFSELARNALLHFVTVDVLDPVLNRRVDVFDAP